MIIFTACAGSVRWNFATSRLRRLRYGGAERGPRHGGARPPSISCMSMACINTAGVTQRNGQSVLRLSASFYSTSSEHVCRGVNLPRLVCRISLESFFFRVKSVSFILVSQKHTDPTLANTLPRASSGSWRDSKAARRHPALRQPGCSRPFKASQDVRADECPSPA